MDYEVVQSMICGIAISIVNGVALATGLEGAPAFALSIDNKIITIDNKAITIGA